MRFSARTIVVTVLVCLLVAGGISLITFARDADEIHVKAYFDKVGGLYSGDEIRVLGIPVGRIDSIKPERTGVVVEFTVSRTQKIPANVNAVVLQPALVSARVIQLTPAYSGGEVLQDGAEIPKARTITPLEWDDIRAQSQALTDSLQPTTPGASRRLEPLSIRQLTTCEDRGVISMMRSSNLRTQFLHWAITARTYSRR